MAPSEDNLRPDGYWRAKSEAGWARVNATAQPVREAATANVMRTFAVNRSYLGMLGYDELASIVVNQLLYDGWTLTPPKESNDEHTERAGRESSKASSG